MQISIVTPSYNQAHFLEHTIRSVLDQGYDNLEYVVIDGGSTDGSVEIIKKYQSQLAYWLSEPDKGHGNALNKGFRQTTGEIMAWLNSDDLYFPWTLRTVSEIFATHPEIDWITGINTIRDDQGRIIDVFPNYKNKYDYLLGRFWIQQESTFWRRSIWEATGGYIDEGYKFMVDGELWTRFFLREPLYHVRCALGGFRDSGVNRSRANMDACLEEMRRCTATMERSSDHKTLSNLAHLRRVVALPRGVASNLYRKMLHFSVPSLSTDTAYNLIAYSGGTWRHRTRAYFI